MRQIITLKYAGRCADCGAELPVGSKARWYGRGRVYGLECHEDARAPEDRVRRAVRAEKAGADRGYVYSLLDRHGVYTPDGRKIGTTCGCEDYPCCGH